MRDVERELEELKKIVREAIESYHDKRIYEEQEKKAEEVADRAKKIVEEYKRRALEKIRRELEGAG